MTKPRLQRVSSDRWRMRRTTRSEPLETITLQLPASMAKMIRAVVKTGKAPNAGAFLEEAVREHLRQRRRDRIYAAYAEASRDPTFIEDMARLERAFDSTTGDGVR